VEGVAVALEDVDRVRAARDDDGVLQHGHHHGVELPVGPQGFALAARPELAFRDCEHLDERLGAENTVVDP
jgi:hypothetical protein